MLLVDDLAAGGTKNLRHTPRGLVTLLIQVSEYIIVPTKSDSDVIFCLHLLSKNLRVHFT